MLAVDTNVVIRYLLNESGAEGSKARKVIDGNEVFVGATVILEAEWVLRRVYQFTGSQVVRSLRALAGLPTVTIDSPDAVRGALDMAEGGMDFADALHLARSSHCQAFVTFDKDFVRRARSAGPVEVRTP